MRTVLLSCKYKIKAIHILNMTHLNSLAYTFHDTISTFTIEEASRRLSFACRLQGNNSYLWKEVSMHISETSAFDVQLK